MTNTEGVDPNIALEAELVEAYGDVGIQVGAFPQSIPLEKALELESQFCTDESRKDPERRVNFILGKVAAAGALKEEHAQLMPPSEG